MFKQWYKYQHHKLVNDGKAIDYRYYYLCIPYFLRKGKLNGEVVHEHRFRIAVSVMKLPGHTLPKVMHVSLPFGFWYGSGALHRTPIAA